MRYETDVDGFRAPATGRKHYSISVTEETHQRILSKQQVVEAALAEVRP